MATLQETAVRVRQLAAIRRVFTYNAERAIGLRGAAGQIAEAEELSRSRPR